MLDGNQENVTLVEEEHVPSLYCSLQVFQIVKRPQMMIEQPPAPDLPACSRQILWKCLLLRPMNCSDWISTIA